MSLPMTEQEREVRRDVKGEMLGWETDYIEVVFEISKDILMERFQELNK